MTNEDMIVVENPKRFIIELVKFLALEYYRRVEN